ncbi:WD40-repeat-containing domain protein [Triangularia setosa]|uniref:Ribosome biogenesis protein YTM1 n=1 Tax=Triangularia setosa TaxID=2587417 RepID=A0AAN6W2W0_9PEZI|nr:WD40-repeat-containing domain protein [Podospora setosa]
MDEPMNDAPGAQVKVTFTTNEADLQLPEEKRQLLVPADIRRYGLSRILNSDLMLDSGSIPFDFLVNGSFLRSSLEDYLNSEGLSLETNLTLQYVRSLIPPVFEASFEHDDWVSSVDVLTSTSPAGRWSGDNFSRGQERILSASYDGLLRIWNASGEVLVTSPSASHGGHSASIKAAKFISSSQLASTGMDRSIRVWKYTDSGASGQAELKPTLELYGHRASVDSLEVDGPSKRILTASADGSVGLWSTSKSTSPEADPSLLPNAHTSKRRKITSSITTPQRGPLFLMQIHNAPATAAVFDPRDRTVGYSISQDHTVKTLDLTTGSVVANLTLSHSLLSLCAIPRSGGAPLLAVGTSARHITLVDPRASAATTSVMTLRGHTNKVVTLAANPENEYSLVSGSHDGTCRIWDLRSIRPASGGETEGGMGNVSEPVYVFERESRAGKKKTVAGEGAKVFGVVWDKELGILSGGEDKKVQVNRGRDVVKE